MFDTLAKDWRVLDGLWTSTGRLFGAAAAGANVLSLELRNDLCVNVRRHYASWSMAEDW